MAFLDRFRKPKTPPPPGGERVKLKADHHCPCCTWVTLKEKPHLLPEPIFDACPNCNRQYLRSYVQELSHMIHAPGTPYGNSEHIDCRLCAPPDPDEPAPEFFQHGRFAGTIPRTLYDTAPLDLVPPNTPAATVCRQCRETCNSCGRWYVNNCSGQFPADRFPKKEYTKHDHYCRDCTPLVEADEQKKRDQETPEQRQRQEENQGFSTLTPAMHAALANYDHTREESARHTAHNAPVTLGTGDDGKPVELAADVRNRHVYIIGKTGSGKSSLLRNLIMQDMAAGRGLIYLDPHGDTAQQLLGYVPADRRDDVVYFCPADPDCPAFNLLATDYAPDKLTRDMVSAIKMFFGDSWGPRLNQLLTYALSTLLLDRTHEPHTLADLEKLLLEEDYRAAIARRSGHPKLTAFWLQQFPTMARDAVHPVLNKLADLLMPLSPMERIFSTPGNSLDLSAIMNSGKILLVNLSKGELGEAGAFLIGGLIVTAVAQAALARVKIPEAERVDCFLYVDEFQNFTVDSFESILSEARKYRLNLTLAHQYLKQVPANLQAAIFGNVAAVVSLPISADDAGTMQREMTNPGEQPTLGDELANIFDTPAKQHPGWTAPQATRDWPTRQDFLTLQPLTGFVKINTPENVQRFTISHPTTKPDPATRAAILDRQRQEHETAAAELQEKKRPPTITQERRSPSETTQEPHQNSTTLPTSPATPADDPDDFLT